MIAKESPATDWEPGHQAGHPHMGSTRRQNLNPNYISTTFAPSRSVRG